MSTLTLTSPGVQINEVDLSLITNTTGNINVLTVGFADQGPTNEIVNVSSISEFESIYGTPKNAAERYLYHSARQVLNTSPASLLVSRLPYGSNVGNGYSNSYSALVYPISTNSIKYADSSAYSLLEPVSILLSDAQHTALAQNNFTWGSSPYVQSTVVLSSYNASTSAAALNSFYTNAFVNSSTDVTNVSFNAVTSAINVTYYPQNNPTVTLTGKVSGNYGGTVVQTGVTTFTTTAVNVNGTITAILPSYSAVSGVTISGYTSALNVASYTLPTITGFASLTANFQAGLVVVNERKTAVNNINEGYYVGIIDNSGVNPATPFTSITGVKAAYEINPNLTQQDLSVVPASRFNFQLSADYNNFGSVSISQVMESYPTGYNFGSKSYSDSLVLVLFKLQSTSYNQNTVVLSYNVAEGYVGSLNANRVQNNPNGGNPVTFFLQNVVNNASSNMSVYTNPYISSQANNGTTWTPTNDSYGNYIPSKSVSVANATRNLYSYGVYHNQTDYNSKVIGNVPLKLQNVLNTIQNDDTIKLDFTVEAGLGTIWASSNAYAQAVSGTNLPVIYDETYNYSSSLGVTPSNDPNGVGTLLYRTDGNPSAWSNGAGFDYLSVATQFVSLANDTRKDHVFIADPIRHLLVQGADSKVSEQPNYIFANNVYWPLNNQFNSINSSYVVTYGNWIKYNDVTSNLPVWIPSSGYVAAAIAAAIQKNFPWSAVAGFTRGALSNVIDVAVNPTQKQRDLLYKVNINPIAYFPNEGYVIYGQKTLYRTPSAFDRLNVRELFINLEKKTQSLLKYYVFEPNTYTTQTRLVGALKPIFDNAKLNNGLYDYLIVCDSRNNTPSVIDNNELAIAIYIQPIKTAEFILCDFIATQTGINFNEVVANNKL